MKNQDQEYPRVLVVGHGLEPTSGTGITLANLFRGWPRARLAVACAAEPSRTDTACDRYYRLGVLEDRWVWPLSYVPREGKKSGPVDLEDAGRGAETMTCPSADEGELRPQKTAKYYLREGFYAALRVLGTVEQCRRPYVSPELLGWAKGFRPDLIYTLLGTLNMVRLVTGLSQGTGAPVVVHMMDDWPSTVSRGGLFSWYARRRLRIELACLLDNAAATMGICDAMCSTFEERYGRRFYAFHNTVEVANWATAATRDPGLGRDFRIAYAGRIGTANHSSLEDVCDVVAGLAGDGLGIRMDIYSPEWKSPAGLRLERPGSVFLSAPRPHSEMPHCLGSSDLLILPLDFDRGSVRFARYSMPAKTSEYMASGTPILVYAPLELAVSSYALQEGWARVVSDRRGSPLREAIVGLIGDSALRQRLSRNALRLASQRHDARKVRVEFQRVLVQAAGCSGTAQSA